MRPLPENMKVCEMATGWIIDADGQKLPALRFHEEGADPDNDVVVPADSAALTHIIDALQRLLEQSLEMDARGRA